MKCYKPNVYKNVQYEYLFLLKNSVWLYKKCLHLLKQDIFMTKIFELFPFTLL